MGDSEGNAVPLSFARLPIKKLKMSYRKEKISTKKCAIALSKLSKEHKGEKNHAWKGKRDIHGNFIKKN